MKFCGKNQTILRKNDTNCIVTEYPMDEKTLDFAIVRVEGRYPKKGLAVNRKVKEIVYVLSGTGSVTVNKEQVQLSSGDLILIEAGEFFYWDGQLTLHISCTPAFSIEQHEWISP